MKSFDIMILSGAFVAFSLLTGTNLEFPLSGKCLSCDFPGHLQVGTPHSIVYQGKYSGSILLSTPQL